MKPAEQLLITNALYWDGISSATDRFPPEKLADVEAHLRALTIHDGHVPLRGNGTSGTWDGMIGRPVVCPPLVGGTITAPHFLEFVLEFTDLVKDYLGGFPYLYSVHSFWTRPSGEPTNPDIQEWHRDRDAERFVTLFILGSDILTYGDGPHLFQRGTHKGTDELKMTWPILGYAGCCFFADTRGLHMGIRPTRGQRLMHWARWCLGTKPRSYSWDQMKAIQASRIPIERPNEKLRESTKLLVNWE